MKKVLIYGDSNVWGDNFLTRKRIDDEKQWANILEKSLKKEYKIFQCGLPGRLAGQDEKENTYKNGKDNFLATFKSFSPLNIIVIALGTNDLQIKYDKDVEQIISDLLWYEEIIKQEYEDLDNKNRYFLNELMPRIIYLLPTGFEYKDNVLFDKNSEIKRQQLLKKFPKLVKYSEVLILEIKELFEDGIHYNYNGHKQVAQIMEKIIKKESENA